jgi:hypothetical protein
VPAPWGIWLAAAAAAALVPAVRRNPRFAIPAVLTTLPWWPVPVPAVALIWTGPLAWVPIAAALGLALAPLGGRALETIRAWAGNGSRAAALATVATLIAGGAAWSSTGHRLRGDEPHYLMITQSLLNDGDLRIENNHDLRQYSVFYPDGRLVPDFTVRGADGEIYSIHAPGASALVLPAFTMSGWRGAQVFLLLLSAVTGLLIWKVGLAATRDAGAAWFGWAATVLTPTFLLHSYAIFPDAPAALVTAAAIALLLRIADDGKPRPRVLSMVGVSALLASLPWLHSRLVVLACGLGALVVWQLWRAHADDSRAAVRRILAFAAIPAVSAAAWFAFFWAVYGAPDPRLPYGGDDEARAAWIPGAILGLLFDQQYGLWFHAPVLAAIWGTCVRRGTGRVAAIAWQVLGVVTIYLAAVTLFRMWWAGIPSAPARFLVAVVPALTVPAAVAWHGADRATRSLLGLLLAAGVAISSVLVAIDGGALAWNQRDAQARFLEWLAPVVNLPRAFPSFFWAGEGAFVAHAAAVVAIVAILWAVIRRAGTSSGWTREAWAPAAVAWLLVATTIAAGAGWRLTGSSGLDPTRSQLAVAAGATDGPALAIAAGRVGRTSAPGLGLVIRTEELDRWREQVRIQSFRNVPAGRYRLRLADPSAASETITATVADSAEPVQIFDPGALAVGGARLTLVGGASVLYLGSPNPDVDMTRWIFTLEPDVLWPGTPASRSARIGAVTLAWRDHAFVEPGGFWVAGQREAHVSIGSPTPTLAVTLTNGPVANTVVVTAGLDRWTFAMAPNEARPLEIAAPEGVTHLAISSSAGFQPSRVSASGDDRLLGVFVEIR